jgi:ADP-heptose:LPS heptosyltransferase
MGIGDAIMAAGEARRLFEKTGRPVLILNARGRIQQRSEVWDGNPYILRTFGLNHLAYNRIINAPGVRPYIVGKTPERWTWKPYKPTPAELFFTEREQKLAKRFAGNVMLEPNVKDNGHTNKAWLWPRWEELAYRIRKELGLQTMQCGPPGSKLLTHVLSIETKQFREAAAILSGARAFVGSEGGLMHAAAATKTPSVILWSEFISPEITGYATMTNLRHAGEPCGRRVDCPGCRKAMEAITVDEVLEALKQKLEEPHG